MSTPESAVKPDGLIAAINEAQDDIKVVDEFVERLHLSPTPPLAKKTTTTLTPDTMSVREREMAQQIKMQKLELAQLREETKKQAEHKQRLAENLATYEVAAAAEAAAVAEEAAVHV